MIGKMRGRFATIVVGIVIGFLAFVFMFFGVYTPSQGLGTQVAGKVNGETISYNDFQRVLERYRRGGMTDEQLRKLGIYNWAWDQLANEKLLLQEADRLGIQASDRQIRDQIKKLPYFQKDGKFSLTTYNEILKANQLSRGVYEKGIRDSILAQYWQQYFNGRTFVSEEEIKRDLMLREEKRNLKYVLLTNQAGKKAFKISKGEAEAYLTEPKNEEKVKSVFERRKDTKYKGKKFEDVKMEIAEAELLDSKGVEIAKANGELADKVVELLNHDKGNDKKVEATLKKLGVKVKETGLFAAKTKFLSGIGESPELTRDAFVKPSPINTREGGKAKKYNVARGIAVAVLIGSESADFSRLKGKELQEARKRLTREKERRLYSQWLKSIKDSAEITRNRKLFGDADDGSTLKLPFLGDPNS